MKILFIDKQEKSAGMGTYSETTIDWLKKRGQQVIPLRYGDKLSHTDPKNTVLLPFFAGSKSTYFIPSNKTIPVAKQVIEKEKPDVIHLSLALSPLDFYFPKLAHDHHIPIVGIFHAGFPSTPSGSLRVNPRSSLSTIGVKSVFISYLPCLRQLDKVIVFSQNVANFLISVKIKKDRVVVIPNSVDTNLYSPGNSHFKKINKIQFAYLFLGRLDRQKNPDLLIDAFLSAGESCLAPTKLIMVGSGTFGTLGEDLLNKYKSHPNIIFTGSITDRKQKIDIIRSADVFVQPSSYEGMSFSLLEAMSCGLAPITTDAGNHAEVIGNSGILLDHTKIPDQLPISLQIFQKNPRLGKEMGKKARQIIKQNYNLDQNINKLINVYKSASSGQA
ncbi:hypothetical protein COT44_05000 [Candidatus Shapirobacteria bacterium CG08_land_8_20_14_0_20_39_18]|uniref:Glycosyltransferase family 1 protein n=1 Tax=Candidatus Shapirobacteria bacterium CG08_land_8_20_14_0_20_39_18 TaxID=1974883 RepID=A0A2M6XBX3_9BACT|nr:MAG: hypothetical protein COT44_05000 [Candidatus Shapirobacteria bacterium CG08_land_8_20_14_0_20_39_18]PIY64894.1 MAG: hypothetical protein COY91_04045 [Candidatus Shapirobacteria bacterium CG_4_10_14_0_8_um_filter_39_15]